MKLSIIVPAYNEEKALGKVLDSLKEISAKNNYETEIIVVDDGSKDRTAEIARARDVKVLRHIKNRGYGASLKTGVNSSKNEIIAIIDADGSYPIEEISGLLEDIDECDMIVGARIKKGAKMSLLRRLPKYFLTKFAEYIVEEKIPDVNSGFRIFKKTIYNKYKSLLPSGFSFTTTITLAFINGYERVKFIPIGYAKREGLSKIKPIRDTLNFFYLIARTSVYFRPTKVFLPLAIFFIFSALAVTLYSIFIMGRFLDTTITLLFVFGIQSIIVALLADLINHRIK